MMVEATPSRSEVRTWAPGRWEIQMGGNQWGNLFWSSWFLEIKLVNTWNSLSGCQKGLNHWGKGGGRGGGFVHFYSDLTGVNFLLTRTCGAGTVRGTVKGFMGCSTILSIPLRRSLDSRPEMGRRSEEESICFLLQTEDCRATINIEPKNSNLTPLEGLTQYLLNF